MNSWVFIQWLVILLFSHSIYNHADPFKIIHIIFIFLRTGVHCSGSPVLFAESSLAGRNLFLALRLSGEILGGDTYQLTGDPIGKSVGLGD